MPSSTQPKLQRVIGEFGLAAAVFNITVGAAIFVLPAHMASSLGSAAPVAYLLCAVATALVALCFAEAGSRVPRIGGPYACIEAAFGSYVGFVCGVLLWLGVTLAMGAVATVFADAVSRLVPALADGAPRVAMLIFVFAILAIANVRGTATGASISAVSTIAKIVPLVVFVALGLPHVHAENIAIPVLPPISKLSEASLLLMFAFFGMETALQVSGEVKDASRIIPRAIAEALFGVLVVYLSVQFVAQGILGPSLAAPENAAAPLAAAAETFGGAIGAKLILVGMTISTFGFLTATTLSMPRTLFALASDGFLPRSLAATHSKYQTPHVAIVVQACIVCAIALTGTYTKLAVISDVAILVPYFACCLAAWRLRKLDVRSDGPPFLMPGGTVVPWLATSLIVGLLAHATAQALLLTSGVIVAASVVYFVQRRPPRDLKAARG